jgi:hypothetical protein
MVAGLQEMREPLDDGLMTEETMQLPDHKVIVSDGRRREALKLQDKAMVTFYVLIEPSTSVETVAGILPRAAWFRRYRYRKLEGHWVKEVIVDIGAEGQVEWAEQYPGELRWFPCTPSAAERAMIERWRISGEAARQWVTLGVMS